MNWMPLAEVTISERENLEQTFVHPSDVRGSDAEANSPMSPDGTKGAASTL